MQHTYMGAAVSPEKSQNALLYVKSDITKVKLITMKQNKYTETETELSDNFLLGRLFTDRTVSTETVISSVFSFAKSGKFNSDARTYFWTPAKVGQTLLKVQ